jgi:hypothetical protein
MSEQLRKVDLELDAPIKPLWESPAAAPVEPKPRLQIPGDDRLTSDFAKDLAQHLLKAGIFTHNGIAVIENASRTNLEPITATRFVTWIEDWVVCYRVKKGEELDRTLSTSDAQRILTSHQFISGLHKVTRYNPIRLPVIAEDGSLALLPTGYDKQTQTLTARGSIQYELDWTSDRSREFLSGLLAEFPFAEPQQSKAAVIAAMLTVYGLHLLSPTCTIPAFIYTANDAGCGKGLCCMLAALPVFGNLPTGVQPSTEGEMEKVLFSAARAGQQLVFFDNVDRHLASPALESFLTTSNVSGRIIGESRFVSCAKKTVVLISGNNCTVRADMRRRSLFVEFFMEQLQAEHRAIRNPLDEAAIVSKRSDILSALYALVRDWFEAGKPSSSRVLQGFTEWSSLIAAIVEHAGFGSPIPLPETNIADEELKEVINLVNALHGYGVGTGIPFRDVVQLCQLSQLFTDKLRSHGELSKQEKTSFSRLLKRYAGRIFPGGLRLVVTGEGHARRYSVAEVVQATTPQPPVVSALPDGLASQTSSGGGAEGLELEAPQS